MLIAKDYFKGQAGVLDGRYKSSVVHGDSADTGTNREHIFSKWLTEHLPKSVSPELGGHIIDAKGNVSGQVDVVLYNDDSPRFGGNPKSYFFAEGTIASIQVKSKLSSGQLKSAIKNLETVKNCNLSAPAYIVFGDRSENILTGIFAYELDTNDFSSIDSVIESLKKYESNGQKPVDFVCINKVGFIAYNHGAWHSTDDKGLRTALPTGYALVDASEECIFRMVLTLSSEASKNIATATDFQSYFIEGWK